MPRIATCSTRWESFTTSSPRRTPPRRSVEYRSAVEYFEKTLACKEDDQDALFNAASLYLELKDCEKGIVLAKKLLDLNPREGRYYDMVGRLNDCLGKKSERVAGLVFSRALKNGRSGLAGEPEGRDREAGRDFRRDAKVSRGREARRGPFLYRRRGGGLPLLVLLDPRQGAGLHPGRVQVRDDLQASEGGAARRHRTRRRPIRQGPEASFSNRACGVFDCDAAHARSFWRKEIPFRVNLPARGFPRTGGGLAEPAGTPTHARLDDRDSRVRPSGARSSTEPSRCRVHGPDRREGRREIGARGGSVRLPGRRPRSDSVDRPIS